VLIYFKKFSERQSTAFLVLRGNYSTIVTVFEIKRNIGQSQSPFFHIPPAFDGPVKASRRNIAITFGKQK